MSEVPFSGVTDFFTTCSPSTCTICPSPGASLYLFQPSLRRSLYFVGGDSTSLWNTEVFRYWLSSESFSRSLRYDVSCGLQTMTSLLGFVGWIGIPDLDPSLYEKVGLGLSNCTLPQPKSYVDVEPVTGRIWQRRIQLQLHAGLRACDVNGHRLRPLNLTYLDKAVPIVSTDRRAILSGAELSFYNYKVDRLMTVSCGGLIGLSVIAAIVVAIGVVILFKPKKINRVGPVLDGESSASNLNSRHINTT
ncbi:uncharacterized protein [Littorina saxatilis]|uniref:uncharacterized protein n=1 Tax=Littorina saxatilis TaxID=31220 RepID=UPI0038B69535